MEIKRSELIAIMRQAEIEPEQLRVEGFASFGHRCPGIVCDGITQLAAFFAAAGRIYVETCDAVDGGFADSDPAYDPADLAKGVVLDSQGLGIVFYWPSLEITEG